MLCLGMPGEIRETRKRNFHFREEGPLVHGNSSLNPSLLQKWLTDADQNLKSSDANIDQRIQLSLSRIWVTLAQGFDLYGIYTAMTVNLIRFWFC